jgi:outer membrane protein OmpA-like peptidoglycan-associated protein
MIKSGRVLILMACMAIVVALATSGCASKKFVRQQVNPVNQKLAQYQKDTNGKIAWMTNKQETDMSQVNERIATTDQHVADLSNAVQSAQGTASRAMEAADENKLKAEENATAISNVANSLNYQLVDKADVMFGFNRATLTPKAKTELDEIASKAQSMPRSVIELAGFTDPVGSANYNLALSRRRAEAVERYLAERNVPIRSIHIVGFGKGPAPEGMGVETQGTSRTQARQMERRVTIRLFGAGDLSGSNPSQQ